MSKKMLILLIVLVAIFLAVWGYKLRRPIDDANSITYTEEIPWWETVREGETPTPSADWVLDPEIPSNYIPVIGQKELYMVVDEDGTILKYRQRTQDADGTWIWEDTDPHIPDNYIAVEGLENVYKVESVDGTVTYYRYTRNEDDSYFFTEVDENGNEIQKEEIQGDEIPKNYVHVSGNVYAVYNEYGVLIGYKERYIDENGNYQWRDSQKPKEQQPQSQQSASSQGKQDEQTESSQQGQGGDIYIYNEGDYFEDNTYQEKETNTETKVEGDWNVVYETTTIRVYDSSGKLIKTKTEGPTEVNRYPVTGFNNP